MRHSVRWGLAAVVAAMGVLYLGCGGSGLAVANLAIGAAMPDFKLQDYSGKDYTLSQFKGKVVVLDFCSQECPFSRGVDPDLESLAQSYAGKDVVFLGIDSHKATQPDAIKKYAEEKKLTLPILKDVDNKYADAVAAARTPEFYVVDKDGKLAYHGAFDNRPGPEAKGTEHYAKDAIDALVAGRPVAKPEVKSWGCGIKRK